MDRVDAFEEWDRRTAALLEGAYVAAGAGPRVADLARSLHPGLAESIWTGSAMSWTPPMRFRYVTAIDDAVPRDHLGVLVDRMLGDFVAPGGRLILSSYTDADQSPRPLFEDLAACGHPPDGVIRIDRPHRHPLLTAWLDA